MKKYIIDFFVLVFIVAYIFILIMAGFHFSFSCFLNPLWLFFGILFRVIFFITTILLIVSLFTEVCLARPFVFLILFLMIV